MKSAQDEQGSIVIFALIGVLLLIIAGLVFYIWQNGQLNPLKQQTNPTAKSSAQAPTVINSSSSNSPGDQSPTPGGSYQNPFDEAQNPFNNLQ